MSYDFGSAKRTYQLKVDSFRGVDFASSPVNVASGRSPNAVNLLSDLAGKPIKRTGYELLGTLAARINGIYRLKTNNYEKLVVHSGTKLYEWQMDGAEMFTLLYDGVADKRSMCLQFANKLWFLDGKKFLVCEEKDGELTISKVEDKAYVPTTIIGANPDGTGGVAFEDGNLLGCRLKNSFYVTAENNTDKVFSLDRAGLDETAVKVQVLKSDGTWNDLSENTDFTLDRAKGTVTMKTAPGASPSIGEDNVVIEFGYVSKSGRERINGCEFGMLYGVDGEANRLFVSGNGECGNYDFWSELDDLMYFPESNYAKLGLESSNIMGYSRIGSNMAVHKEDNGQDVTVFLRRGSLDSEDSPIFPIFDGVSGVGAVSRGGFAVFNAEPIFVANEGVYAVTTQDVTGNKYAELRSYYVNPKLLAEADLRECVGIEYNNFFYLAVGGHVYVADGRQKVYEQNASSSSFQYEWYYFDNVPVRVWFERDGRLYFGSADGKIYRFYQANEHSAANNVYYDDTVPIKAVWDTPYFTFGHLGHLKKLTGFWLMLAPYHRSGVNIYYRAKGDLKAARAANADIFDFNDIDFNRFTFNTDDSPMVVATNLPLRRFMQVQFRFENEKAEAFGFYGFEVQYILQGRYRKI